MATKKKLEAKVKALSPRGEPWVINGKLFPPGEWVEITPGEAAVLKFKGDRVEIRGGDD